MWTVTSPADRMKIEHFALNVADPVAMAEWYCEYCGLRVVRHIPQPVQTHFLADSDATVLEIYYNPRAKVPDYRSMDPLLFHLAMASSEPIADAKRLMLAGASFIEEVNSQDGSHLLMLRDPWGTALQLCKRAKNLL